MAKYKLKTHSVHIKGILYRSEDNPIFDTEGKHESIKQEILAAAAAGFLENYKEEKPAKDQEPGKKIIIKKDSK